MPGDGVPGQKECQSVCSSNLTFICPVVTCKRVVWAVASAACSSVLASALSSWRGWRLPLAAPPPTSTPCFPSEGRKLDTSVERSGVLFKITSQAVLG